MEGRGGGDFSLLGGRTASAAEEGSVAVSTEAKCVPARMFLATSLTVAKSWKQIKDLHQQEDG